MSYLYVQQYLRCISTMRQNDLRRCLIAVLVFTFIQLTMPNKENANSNQPQTKSNHQNGVEKQQYELEEQFKNQEQQDLSEWIVEQLRYNQQHPEIQPYEAAIFMLQPNVTQLYRIPVSLTQTMLVEVSIFETTQEGHIILPQNPPQQSYVQVSTMDEPKGVQFVQGKIYLSRIIELRFTGKHKYLKFTNKADHPLIVLLDIEQQQLLMEIAVSDDQFALTSKKMQMVLEETKNTEINREHIYKWQWGFYEKHERHQSDMLGFTGVELLVIVATSIVQMYCIKNLIGNELII